MKVKNKIKLIMLMLVIMAAALFAGCTIGPESLDDFLERNELKATVTYYANGGHFGDSSMSEFLVEFREGSPIMPITESSDPMTVSYSKYVLTQWVYVETDNEGNPVYLDEAKEQLKLTDRVVNFDNITLQAGDNLHIAAMWAVDVTLDYVLVSTAPVTMTVTVTNEDGTTERQDKVFNSGDVFFSEPYSSEGVITISDISKVNSSDSTYLEYFTDEACSKSAIGQKYNRPEDGVNNRVYARYTQGVYTVVKTASHVSNMFYALAGQGSYYIYNDVDCSSLFTGGTSGYLSLRSADFSVSIEGNGYALKGLRFRQNNIDQGRTYSMLGNLTANAKINNLTLSDVVINTTIKGDFPNIYLINNDIATGATLNNFVIEDISLSISNIPEGMQIANIRSDGAGGYITTNWMFGGATTDAEFISSNSGVTVRNASLIIESVTILDNVSTTAELSNITASMPYYIMRKENI